MNSFDKVIFDLAWRRSSPVDSDSLKASKARLTASSYREREVILSASSNRSEPWCSCLRSIPFLQEDEAKAKAKARNKTEYFLIVTISGPLGQKYSFLYSL